jgi:hypothetical protein
MLLPAVNAAREAARRATCMNNQSQLALACINYDGAKQNLPAMRAQIAKANVGGDETVHHASWIGFLLPYMELNQLYQNLASGQIHSDTSATADSRLYYGNNLIMVKSFRCPSAEIPTEKAGVHYVCNGGYQNAIANGWGSTAILVAASTGWPNRPWDPGKIADAVFFDHLAGTDAQVTDGPSNPCKATVSIDYISSHSGTGNTILLSENINDVKWAVWDGTIGTSPDPNIGISAGDESEIAFCYPWNANFTALADTTSTTITRMAEYGATTTNWSYQGYTSAPSPQLTGDTTYAAFFINIARGEEYNTAYGEDYRYRRARPSSNHPGIVLAAFADRSTRPLSDSMDRQIFVWLCQPNSGQVLSGDAF